MVAPSSGEADHSTVRASAPFFACQKCSATTATPVAISTTVRTPATALAARSSKRTTFAPKTGGRTTTACSMPGTSMSMP